MKEKVSRLALNHQYPLSVIIICFGKDNWTVDSLEGIGRFGF